MQEEIKQPKFFGRRKGRVIRKTKSTLLENFLPKIKIDENTCFDKKTLFGKEVEKINLEIGFGDGVHLAGQAAQYPNIGFIGIEVFKNGTEYLGRDLSATLSESGCGHLNTCVMQNLI